ncbi:MAG: hypothetical protein K6U74_19160, partial [Firmicutes bacterium]|nr:hypothetical protein [Bacillota bacterium]
MFSKHHRGKLSTRILSLLMAMLIMLSGFTGGAASASQSDYGQPSTVTSVYGADSTSDPELTAPDVSAYSLEAASGYVASDIALTPGKNASELNFAWYSGSNPAGSVVQIARKSDMSGGEF